MEELLEKIRHALRSAEVVEKATSAGVNVIINNHAIIIGNENVMQWSSPDTLRASQEKPATQSDEPSSSACSQSE
ncbi:MAG: hypothetical protein ACTJHW_14515 [Paenalcaligenes sp.]